MVLERIGSQIDRLWNRGRNAMARKRVVLDFEVNSPVVVANGVEAGLAIIEEFVATGFLRGAAQIRQLIIAVEMHFEGLVAGL